MAAELTALSSSQFLAYQPSGERARVALGYWGIRGGRRR